MPWEVLCGQCQGVLTVETIGVVVECPLCGAHLQVSAEDVAPESVHAADGLSSHLEPALSGIVTSAPASTLAKAVAGSTSAVHRSASVMPEGHVPPTLVETTPSSAVPPASLPATWTPSATDAAAASIGSSPFADFVAADLRAAAAPPEASVVPSPVAPESSWPIVSHSSPNLLANLGIPSWTEPTLEPMAPNQGTSESAGAALPKIDVGRTSADHSAPVMGELPALMPGELPRVDPQSIPAIHVAVPPSADPNAITGDLQSTITGETPGGTLSAWPGAVPQPWGSPASVPAVPAAMGSAPLSEWEGVSAAAAAMPTGLTADLASNPAILAAATARPNRASVGDRLSAESSSAPATAPTNPDQVSTTGDVVPRQWFVLLASYASAATLVLLYLLYSVLTFRTSNLESLPDLVPKIRKDGQVEMLIPRPQATLPVGHVLKLGESQRFGSVVVTPVKITREPLHFVHHTGRSKLVRQPSAPVLKLWLKFENVSRDQTFPPLDATVLFKRIYGNVGEPPKTNQFFCQQDQQRSDGIRFFLYDQPENSEFLIAGQRLEQDVAPGETYVTFVPSEEGDIELDGPCVWRVQFRKGYNRSSGRGVTTLIDVRFDASEITADSSKA
jgi:hypothetical protein